MGKNKSGQTLYVNHALLETSQCPTVGAASLRGDRQYLRVKADPISSSSAAPFWNLKVIPAIACLILQ